MSNNPCTTAGQAVKGFNAIPGASYLTPNCGYLFWMLNASNEVEYTGNVRVTGNLVATGNMTTNNVTTSSINGSPIGNYVSIPELAPNLSA